MAEFTKEVKELEYEWRNELDITDYQKVCEFYSKVCDCYRRNRFVSPMTDNYTKILNIKKWLERKMNELAKKKMNEYANKINNIILEQMKQQQY